MRALAQERSPDYSQDNTEEKGRDDKEAAVSEFLPVQIWVGQKILR